MTSAAHCQKFFLEDQSFDLKIFQYRLKRQNRQAQLKSRIPFKSSVKINDILLVLHAQAATDRVQEPIQGVLNVLDYSAHHHGSLLKELALANLVYVQE